MSILSRILSFFWDKDGGRGCEIVCHFSERQFDPNLCGAHAPHGDTTEWYAHNMLSAEPLNVTCKECIRCMGQIDPPEENEFTEWDARFKACMPVPTYLDYDGVTRPRAGNCACGKCGRKVYCS